MKSACPLSPWLPRLLAVCLLAAPAWAQAGALRLTVQDASGRPLRAAIALASEANQFQRTSTTDRRGRYFVADLPVGLYRLTVTAPGFTPGAMLFEVRSPIPVTKTIVLAVAGVHTRVEVSAAATLLDPHRTGPVYAVSPRDLGEQPVAAPGRGVLGAIVAQPGWLLEANGVLHPRESEYDVQYVVNGLPLLDNRSPAFAPPLAGADVQSLRVLTGDYPAEYGRKLGGVVEVTTRRVTQPGWHAAAVASAGSFATGDGYFAIEEQAGANGFDASLQGAHTRRFLDPPVPQNYANTANSLGASFGFERDGRTGFWRLYLQQNRNGFLVPNEQVQQAAGQRQDRRNHEALGQLTFEHQLAPDLLLSLRAMWRDLNAALWSNPNSTPILPAQARGVREGYAQASLSAERGRNQIKLGGDVLLGRVHEAFSYRITDASYFDPSTPPGFQFAARAWDRESAAYAEDLLRAGAWTLSFGLRWDSYRLLVARQALSPRLGVAWYWPAADLALHASYDRAFQTPPIENLLLSSSPAAQRLSVNGIGLPVPPSYGDFYQAGFAKRFHAFRLDENYFRRRFRNFFDDDLLLNTGVSFPISFSAASIYGWETKLEVPAWGRWSGFLSYSNQLGTAQLPITGGLFLDPGAAALLAATDRFPASQDQRNTAAARIRYQLTPSFWLASQASYGSGLPAEIGADNAQLAAQYGPQVLGSVNFARGRVRPSFSLDLAGGVTLWTRGERRVTVEADVENLTNRFNVINFAGLFSGTALAAPRSFGLRLASDL